MTYDDGRIITGIWKNDKIEKGVITYPQNHTSYDKYEGGLKEGKRNGIGKMFYNDRKEIEGIWENDILKDGNVKIREYFTDTNGKNLYYTDYYGNWKGGETGTKNGNGTLEKRYYEANNIDENYNGEWKNDKKHGRGILKTFLKNMPHSEYDGEWENDKKHGYGTMRNYNGGGDFSGMWVENRPIR
jgi:hypothetical protein